MNLKSAEIQIESVAQMEAMSVVKSLYSNLVIPALRAADSTFDVSGYTRLDRKSMASVGINPFDVNDVDQRGFDIQWCWNLFNDLTQGPLVTKKNRHICLSNLNALAENIALIRRRLLVQSHNNSNYMYGVSRELSAELFGDIDTAAKYNALTLEGQLKQAGKVYSRLLDIIIACHPNTIDTQINMSDSRQVTVVVWGSFKKAKNSKS